MSKQAIHPSAIISPNAQIANNVEIGPFCVVGEGVKLHEDVVLKSHVVIEGNTEVGQGTLIHPFACIGAAPQDLKYKGEASKLVIGKNNTIREHATMHPGTEDGGMITKIGDNGLFMIGTHIAHDCIIGNNVIFANSAAVAGHVHVGDFAIIGAMSGVHQFIRIGQHAIIGAMSAVDTDVIPYGLVKGERAHLNGLNLIGLERRGFDRDQVKAMQNAYDDLFGGQGTLSERIERVSNDYRENEAVANIITFALNKTKFPLCQPAKKH